MNFKLAKKFIEFGCGVVGSAERKKAWVKCKELTSLEQRNKYLHLTEINGQIMIQYLLLSSLYQKKKKKDSTFQNFQKTEKQSLVENSVFPVARPQVVSNSRDLFPSLWSKVFPQSGDWLLEMKRNPSAVRSDCITNDGQAECQIAAAILFVPEMLTNCQCAPSTASQTAFKASCKSLLPSRAFTRAVHLKSRQSLDR